MSKYQEYISLRTQIEDLNNKIKIGFKEALLEESSKVFLEHPELLEFSGIGRQEYNDSTYDYYFTSDEYDIEVKLSNGLSGNLEQLEEELSCKENISDKEHKDLMDKLRTIYSSCSEILNKFYTEDWQQFAGEENRVIIRAKSVDMEYNYD